MSLLRMLDNKDELRNALDKFDVATQLNAFDKIKEELLEISKAKALVQIVCKT